MLVIDDRLLFEVVVESEDDAVGSFREAGDRGELYTTGYWYWRLARAIAHPVGGALSGPFHGLPEGVHSTTREGKEAVEFSWLGFDEGDEVGGRGWAALETDGSLSGHIYFHLGDDSGFRAQRG